MIFSPNLKPLQNPSIPRTDIICMIVRCKDMKSKVCFVGCGLKLSHSSFIILFVENTKKTVLFIYIIMNDLIRIDYGVTA